MVVVQIVCGVLLGPGVLGAALPEVHALVFTEKVIAALSGIAWWAVMMFVWIAGIELDLHETWAKRRETATVALLALVVPLALGALAAVALLNTDGWVGPRGAYWQVVLGIGMACAVTALPILVQFMENMDILRSNLGQRILRYASLDDVAIWAVLALILLDWERVARQGGFFVAFIPAALIARRLIAAANEPDRWILGLIWLVACGLGADWAGLHYMVGAFLSGAVLDSRWYKLERMDVFRSTVLLTVMPVFFLSTGLRTSWDMGGIGVFAAAGLLLIASVGGKLIGVQIAGRMLRWEPGEASIIGWLLQTKALIMIIFVNILLDKQIITSTTFTALLLMAVGSTMLTMPVVSPLLARYRHIRGKSVDDAAVEEASSLPPPITLRK